MLYVVILVVSILCRQPDPGQWLTTNWTLVIQNPNENKQRKHSGLVTCNLGHQSATTFNWCQTLVSKYRLWVAQLHNYHPDVAARLIGHSATTGVTVCDVVWQ